MRTSDEVEGMLRAVEASIKDTKDRLAELEARATVLGWVLANENSHRIVSSSARRVLVPEGSTDGNPELGI